MGNGDFLPQAVSSPIPSPAASETGSGDRIQDSAKNRRNFKWSTGDKKTSRERGKAIGRVIIPRIKPSRKTLRTCVPSGL